MSGVCLGVSIGVWLKGQYGWWEMLRVDRFSTGYWEEFGALFQARSLVRS